MLFNWTWLELISTERSLVYWLRIKFSSFEFSRRFINSNPLYTQTIPQQKTHTRQCFLISILFLLYATHKSVIELFSFQVLFTFTSWATSFSFLCLLEEKNLLVFKVVKKIMATFTILAILNFFGENTNLQLLKLNNF